MHDAGSRGHVEFNVLQACSLRSRPVYTSTCCPGCDIRRVDDEVTDLAVEVVHGNPIQVLRPVGIAVDQTESRKVSSSFESRGTPSVSYEHGEVIRDDRRRDEVCAGREVDHSRSDCSRSLMSVSCDCQRPMASTLGVEPEPQRTHPLPQRFPPAVMAALIAAVSSVTPSPDPHCQHHRLDRVFHAQHTSGAIVLHVPEHRIAAPCIWSKTLMGDLFQPISSLYCQYQAGKGQEQSIEGTHGQL